MNNKTPTSPLTKLDGFIAPMVGLIAFTIYLRTLAPGLLSGDSGEFQTLAYLWGHTHPTGYPVYLLLAKPFTWLPVGDIAYRVNFFSAFMAGVTVAGVFACGRLLTTHRWPPILGALALAVSPTFWSQAIIAEVYTAATAFLVAILLAVLLWDATGQAKFLLIAGFLGGLALGVHLTVMLFAPAVLVFLAIGRHRGWRAWRAALLGGAIGVLLALLIFLLVDWHNPAANYFDTVIRPSRSAWELTTTDLDSPFERLLFGLSAQQFNTFMFANIAEVMPEQAAIYWANLPSELSWLAITLAALGLVALFYRNWPVGVLLTLALAAQWFYTFNYQIWDLLIFFIPGYVLLAVLTAVGLDWLVNGMYRLIPFKSIRVVAEITLGLLILIWGVWPVFSARLTAVTAGDIPFNDYPTEPHAIKTLHLSLIASVENMPQDSIVFVDWDILYPLYYVAHIEQERADLTFIETFPRDDTGKLADSVIDYIKLHIDDHPIFFTERVPEMTAAGYTFKPMRVSPQIKAYQVEPPAKGNQ